MKLPNIPFLPKPSNPIRRKVVVNTSPDEERIKRELTYLKRLGASNPKVVHLQKRIQNQKRRSYGTR